MTENELVLFDRIEVIKKTIVMMALGYPPDMIQEQYDKERDTEWCYNYVGMQMKERGLLDEE